MKQIVSAIKSNWLITAVLASYVITAFIVPTLAPVAISDDWIYARSVEILLSRHELRILPTTVPTAVFQVAWGSIFASVLGMSFGALRVSTVVITLFGACALNGLCRQLGIDRQLSALGTAVYLFSPLGFVLGFTFMTDPHLTALLVIATYLYVRGLGTDAGDGRYILLGSCAAALAFLVRQQGILVPVAVVSYLLLTRRLRWTRTALPSLFQVLAIPALTAAAYYVWLRFANGVPSNQEHFLANVMHAGAVTSGVLIGMLAFIEAMYLGLFALPLAVAALPALPEILRWTAPLGRRAFLLWLVVFLLAFSICSAGGMRMPYIPHFFNQYGLGPSDLVVNRPQVLTHGAADLLTVGCGLAILVLGAAFCSHLGGETFPRAMALTLVIALWQVLGVLAPSFNFRNSTVAGLPAPSLDRYLLPLLPFAVCLGLWCLHGRRLAVGAAWLVTAGLAVFAVAGTRDSLVFQDATWRLAWRANAAGISNSRLDAGAAWDGYYLYEYSLQHQTAIQTPQYEVPAFEPASPVRQAPPWWITHWAQATDSSYVIVPQALSGFHVVDQLPFSMWLRSTPGSLYLLRRPDVAGPP